MELYEQLKIIKDHLNRMNNRLVIEKACLLWYKSLLGVKEFLYITVSISKYNKKSANSLYHKIGNIIHCLSGIFKIEGWKRLGDEKRDLMQIHLWNY